MRRMKIVVWQRGHTFGNWCTMIVLASGALGIYCLAIGNDGLGYGVLFILVFVSGIYHGARLGVEGKVSKDDL